jgi:hypothetical protein
MAGTFIELEKSAIPRQFQGSYESVTVEGIALRVQGDVAAWTTAGLGALYGTTWQVAPRKHKHYTFTVEAFCVLTNQALPQGSLIKINEANGVPPPLPSCVLADYIKAEQWFATGTTPRNPTTFSRDRVATLLKHEVGHYRIFRLIGLDLYRTVAAQGIFPNPDAARTQFDNTVATYKIIANIIQSVYELVTKFGRDEAEQNRWSTLLGTAESEAGEWRTTLPRIGSTFFPGLQHTLTAQQSGHERETALTTDLLGIYSGTADADKAKAEEIFRRLDAAVRAIREPSPQPAAAQGTPATP